LVKLRKGVWYQL